MLRAARLRIAAPHGRRAYGAPGAWGGGARRPQRVQQSDELAELPVRRLGRTVDGDGTELPEAGQGAQHVQDDPSAVLVPVEQSCAGGGVEDCSGVSER
ncbi:hypothetical protein [Streptomyces paromomycinus]|uniref:hypothetical protein n=1 Tax=Streptomyces paromomycinus TaxID=92743 RepID=UPI000F61F109